MNIECALRRQSLSRVPNLGKPETYSRQHFDELTLQNKEKPLRELLVSIMEQERDDDLNSLSTQKRPVVAVGLAILVGNVGCHWTRHRQGPGPPQLLVSHRRVGARFQTCLQFFLIMRRWQ